MSDLRIRALGSPHIEFRSQLIMVDTRKAIALLIYLAIEERHISRDALVGLLWPDYEQSRARAALRRTLSALHKALDESDDLAIERERVGLARASSVWIDTRVFRELLAQRRTHGHSAREVCVDCVAPLTQAIALYRDDFLAGFSLRDSSPFEEWQLIQRQTLRDELAEALAALTRGYILRQAFAEAIPVARRWLALDRLNEQAHRFLMRLYDWSGQRAAALRQYRDCTEILDQELGVAPLEATTRLYEAIREHRAPGPPQPSRAPDAPSTNAGDGDTATRLTPPPTPSASRPVARVMGRVALPLIGRASEWEATRNAYEASGDTGRLLVIEGEAGIGKTRMAEELIAHARRLGAVVVAARCYEGETALAYALVTALLRSSLGAEPAARLRELPDTWLSEALRLLPELADVRPGVPAPPLLDNPGAQTRFFEGLRQALLTSAATGVSPGLLLIDDAQWMDEASLDALTYLIRRVERQSLCIALTWRSGDVDARHRLRGLLAEAQRANRAAHVALHRLDEPAVREWLREALGDAGGNGVPRADAIAERLYRETEGLPFFVSEYALAFSNGTLAMDAQTWSAPTGVYDLLRSRLHALSETAWQALTAAAALGRSFDFDTVRETSGRSEEETATALEELAAHGLIGEAPEASHGEIDYDFTHEKLRTLVYEETSLARRRLLHRRAAETLEEASRRQRQGTERAAEIAQHYIAAGNEMAAATYSKLAGERARELYANADALRHFQLALVLGHPDVAGLREAIGDAHTLRGEYALALRSYEMAAANRSGAVAASVEHKIGLVHLRRGEWEAARNHFEAALDAVGNAGAEGERARIYADWSLVARRQGRLEEAQSLGEQALSLAIAGADALALVQAHNILGILASGRDEPERAIAHLEKSLALADQLDDPAARAAALNNLALALSAAGQTERALPLAEAALALCVALGDRHHEAALHNTLADLLHASGHAEDAMAHLKQAVAIYAEIGVEAGAVQPGIWNMAEW